MSKVYETKKICRIDDPVTHIGYKIIYRRSRDRYEIWTQYKDDNGVLHRNRVRYDEAIRREHDLVSLKKYVEDYLIGKHIRFYDDSKQDNSNEIAPCTIDHLLRYAQIYAQAFSGPPWFDPWKEEDATIHLKEILEMKQSYGLECLINGEVVGFILGSSMLFHYGRSFDINDLAVDPAYQRRGIARKLVERLLADLKEQGIADVHLITAGEGVLPKFYEEFGFGKDTEVVLMGRKV